MVPRFKGAVILSGYPHINIERAEEGQVPHEVHVEGEPRRGNVAVYKRVKERFPFFVRIGNDFLAVFDHRYIFVVFAHIENQSRQKFKIERKTFGQIPSGSYTETEEEGVRILSGSPVHVVAHLVGSVKEVGTTLILNPEVAVGVQIYRGIEYAFEDEVEQPEGDAGIVPGDIDDARLDAVYFIGDVDEPRRLNAVERAGGDVDESRCLEAVERTGGHVQKAGALNTLETVARKVQEARKLGASRFPAVGYVDEV